MKKLSLLLILALVSMFGFAENKTITITAESGFKSSYGDESLTIDGVGFSYSGLMYNGKGSPTSLAPLQKQVIQARKSGSGAGCFWNTTDLKNIISLTVDVVESAKGFTIFYGDTQEPTTDSTAMADITATSKTFAYTDKNSVAATATVNSYKFNLNGAKYFKFENGGNASYISSIIIEYSESTPIDTTSVDTTAIDTTIYTIANTKETAYTVAQARALVDAGEDLATRVYVKGVVSTITSSADNVAKYKNFDAYIKDPETDGSVSFELYHCFGLDSAAVETLPIALNDTVIAYGAMTKYNDTYEFSKNCYLVEIRPCAIVKKDISNTAETAYTVSEAITLINDPASDLTKEVYVKGTVTGTPSIYTGDNGNATFDVTDGTNTITMFRVFDINNAKFTSEDAVKEGDQVVMVGNIKNYNGAMEMNPGRIYEINHLNDALENISGKDNSEKVMINGQIFIIRNGEIFTVMGQNVK